MNATRLHTAEPPRVRAHIRGMLAPYHRRLYVVAAVTVAVTLLTLAGPALLGQAIDRGVLEGSLAALNVIGVLFLVVAVALPLLSRAQTLLMAEIGENFLADLRERVFESMVSLPLGVLEREPSDALLSRLTSDVEALASMVRDALPTLIRATLLLSIAAVVLLVLSPLLTLVTLVGVPSALVAAVWYKRRSAVLYAVERERTGDVMGTLHEGLSGLREVQAFGREGDHRDRLSESHTRLIGAYLATAARNRLRPTVTMSQVLATAAVLAGGAYFIAEGSVTLGVVASFVLYVALFFDPIEQLIEVLDEFQAGTAALARIVGVIEASEDAPHPNGVIPLPENGALEARGVSFGYESGTAVIHDINLRIEAGSSVALVGATGAGKTTLARLLARMHDPDEGEIRFGGVDVRDADADSLRERILVAAQEGHLFAGSVADNVRFAHPKATDADVEDALRRIGAYERFARLPDGLATDVQARGARLSSGERQLLALGRVALADPSAVILDEATSSLDPATEAEVEGALRAVGGDRTLVLIAHRLTTAARADTVAVMEDGRLVEFGTHEELLGNGGSYAALWRSWVGRAM